MKLFLVLVALTALAQSVQIKHKKQKPNWVVVDGPKGAPGLFINQDPDAAAPAAAAAANNTNKVTVNVVLKSVFMVGEDKGQIGMQVMMQLVWTDPTKNGPPLGMLVKPEDVFNPNVQFLNAVHTELRKEKVLIYPGGLIKKTKRFYLTLQEAMDYSWYPFDSHMWNFDFNSFTETSDRMVFVPGFLSVDDNFKCGLFSFGKTMMQVETIPAPLFPGQTFSTVRVGIVAKRQTSNTFSSVIFPAIVVVFLAYLSLWILPQGPLPARAALCIVSILTTLVLSGSIPLPKISYTTWIDVFINAALAFVAGCSVVMVLAHRNPKQHASGANNIDYYARRIYPVAFFTFFFILISVGLIAAPGEKSLLKVNHAQSLIEQYAF